MLVFDTSAYINSWRDHYEPATFPSVWELIAAAINDGRIISPREVFNELVKKDDEVAAWAKEREGLFIEPSAEVQLLAGQIYAQLPNPGIRDAADPFVIAEAQIRAMTVVTYEGRNYGGPTKNWDKRMPGICQQLGVACCTVPQALKTLGASF
jgi:Domain of unknown function (DUF4411)